MTLTWKNEKSKPDGMIVFRPSRSIWWVTFVSFLVVLAMTVGAFFVGLEWWYRLGFVTFSGLFVFAFFELSRIHVTLDLDKITFNHGFRRREIPRAKIESVTWAKGGGVSLKLVDGQWVGLPGVGRTSQGLTNSIRAWLKRTGKDQTKSREVPGQE